MSRGFIPALAKCVKQEQPVFPGDDLLVGVVVLNDQFGFLFTGE